MTNKQIIEVLRKAYPDCRIEVREENKKREREGYITHLTDITVWKDYYANPEWWEVFRDYEEINTGKIIYSREKKEMNETNITTMFGGSGSYEHLWMVIGANKYIKPKTYWYKNAKGEKYEAN